MTEIYLSGPICGLTPGEASKWRDYIKSGFTPGIIGIDPLRGKHDLLGELPIGNHTSREATHPMLTAKGITTRDRLDVERCDAMVVYLRGMTRDMISVGTCIEMGWADIYRKPTIVIAEPDSYAANHPMFSELTSYRVEWASDAAAIINHMFATSR